MADTVLLLLLLLCVCFFVCFALNINDGVPIA